jgi:hypothetical protein
MRRLGTCGHSIPSFHGRLGHGAIVAFGGGALGYSSQRWGSLNTILNMLPSPLRGS